MIVTWAIALRIAALVVVAVILQASFLSFLSILGAAPDVLFVLIAALGLLGGALVGAVSGFATGLLLDSLLLQTLGASSLALLAVGYLAGRYREAFEIEGRFVPAAVAGVLTLLGTAGYAGLQLMLGVQTDVSLLVVREVVVKALLAFLLMIPTYPLVRFLLRPALVDAEPAQRRVLLPGRRRRALRRGNAPRRVRRTATPGRVT
ncbi:MAG TPA: rod shape-determining protein MreD [Solirubrobacterales bacterium]|jgi:rod shape-determining protein MreD